MAGPIELLKGISASLLHYPFFMELADAYVENFPDDESVTAAIDRICANQGLSKWDIQSQWVQDSFWVWGEVLSAHGVERAPGDDATKALAQEWVSLVKITCGNLDELECEALDMLEAGIVRFVCLGFDESESADRFIVLHFHIGGDVYILWAEDPFVDPAGFYVD